MHINCDALALFWYWIRERENIRGKRARNLPPPWTVDPILANNHFCNVHREDDRGTVQIRAVVRRHTWLGTNDLPWVYTLARLLNKAESLDLALAYIKTGDDWVEALKNRRAQGETVFSTAYVVSTNGRRMDKLDFVRGVVDAVRDLVHLSPHLSLEKSFTQLTRVHGLGSFLAGQIIADLKNDYYLEDAGDWFTWSCIGPGSKKGLDYIFGGGTTPTNYRNRVDTLRERMPDSIQAMKIHNQDLQNCLCEFSKYMMLREGTRKRSRPYKPVAPA